MSAGDLVRDPIGELYSVDPDDFTDRRTALATQARQTDKVATKEITALHKPTGRRTRSTN